MSSHKFLRNDTRNCFSERITTHLNLTRKTIFPIFANRITTPINTITMKKNIITLCLLAMTCAAVTAQVKKRPTAKKPAVAAKKPVQTKVNDKFAILQLDEWANNGLFEDAENIYILDYPNGESNALRAVNKKTGEIKIVIPKKTRRRAKILSAGADSTNLYFRLADIGLVKYNGTDVNTSEVILPEREWNAPDAYLTKAQEYKKIITSTNGRYLGLLEGATSLVFDQKEHRVTGFYERASDGLLSDNGTLVYIYLSDIGAVPKGLPTPSSRNKQNAIGCKIWKMKEIGNGGGGELSGIWRDDVDSMIYVGMGEQVMRSPMKKMKWEEAYCLPGENKKFTRIACNGKHVLAVTDNYQKHFYEWNNKDLKGEPKISQELTTGIEGTYGMFGMFGEIKFNQVDYLYCDWNGNFWMQEGDGKFYIYNPDGIKGLAALKGKQTNNKLPEEE